MEKFGADCSGCMTRETYETALHTHPEINPLLAKSVYHSFLMDQLVPENFHVEPKGEACRVIQVIPGELLTNEVIEKLDFTKENGVDTERDIVKLAVCERHMSTGHIGLGYIQGLGIRRGALASSVSHDSHNLIIVGATEEDMALAGNTVREMNGGLCVVCDGKVLARLPLFIGGLMSDQDASTVAKENAEVRAAVEIVGRAEGIDPFMNTAFVSLSVIPSLKMTTHGLVNVDKFELVPLFVDQSMDE